MTFLKQLSAMSVFKNSPFTYTVNKFNSRIYRAHLKNQIFVRITTQQFTLFRYANSDIWLQEMPQC